MADVKDTAKAVVGTLAFAGIGAVVGTAMDVVSSQLLTTLQVANPAYRAALQLSAGVLVLTNVTGMIAATTTLEGTGLMPFMVTMFLVSQPTLLSDFQLMSHMAGSGLKGALNAQPAAEDAPTQSARLSSAQTLAQMQAANGMSVSRPMTDY